MTATYPRDIILYHPLSHRLIVLTFTLIPKELHKISTLLTNSRSYKQYHTSEAYQEKRRSEYNILKVVVQGLLRSDLYNYLRTYWYALIIGDST